MEKFNPLIIQSIVPKSRMMHVTSGDVIFSSQARVHVHREQNQISLVRGRVDFSDFVEGLQGAKKQL